MKSSSQLLRLLVTLSFCWTAFSETSIYDEVYNNPDLQEFRKLVDNNPVVSALIQHSTVTVFAPTNAAIVKDSRVLRKDLASYHVANVLLEKELFPVTQLSQLGGAAPLYLNVREDRPHPNSHEHFQHLHKKEYFVNNAKILKDRLYSTKDGNKQLLYTIDELLEPYIPSTPQPPLALDVIRNPQIYQINENWSQFYSKIESTRQMTLFEENANHTFFVPLDLAKPSTSSFDQYVVRGHVIPNKVLFLRTMGKESYPSAAYDGIVNVELSLLNRTARVNNEQTYNVQSNTLKSDPRHNKGVVMSNIVRANIPVKNGVIHLIRKPLMIIENTITDFLEEEKDARLSTFYRLINTVPEIRSEIGKLDQKTILAPTDTAFTNLNESPDDNKLDFLIKNPEELKKLLQLHMAPQSVSTDDVRTGTKTDVLSYDNRNLYFRVVGDDKNRRLTVEGGGVNATAIQADIGATNGIIHIIDRVLGMPFQNIFDKLRTDPDLSFTYELGLHGQQNWNEKLSRVDRRFTYFVPSNVAWERYGREFPSEYKQLKEKLYPMQTRTILDRLLVVNQQISSQQLEGLTDVYTSQGLLTVKKISGYAHPDIEWEGIRARIIRPDVQAINGVIHVIDTVLMKQRDLTVGSSNITLSNITLLIIALIIGKLYRKIHY